MSDLRTGPILSSGETQHKIKKKKKSLKASPSDLGSSSENAEKDSLNEKQRD